VLDAARAARVKSNPVQRSVGEMQGETARKARSAFNQDDGVTAVVDAVLFLAILGFSAVALVAFALAAPLAIAVTAAIGALSAATVRNGAKRGWRLARAD
jgi:hypothetical protein